MKATIDVQGVNFVRAFGPILVRIAFAGRAVVRELVASSVCKPEVEY